MLFLSEELIIWSHVLHHDIGLNARNVNDEKDGAGWGPPSRVCNCRWKDVNGLDIFDKN